MGVGVKVISHRWKSRTIPFTVASSYPSAQIPHVIHPALLHWEMNTLYRFVEWTPGSAEDYIEFRRTGPW